MKETPPQHIVHAAKLLTVVSVFSVSQRTNLEGHWRQDNHLRTCPGRVSCASIIWCPITTELWPC